MYAPKSAMVSRSSFWYSTLCVSQMIANPYLKGHRVMDSGPKTPDDSL